MTDFSQKILEQFGHRLRVRVCGLCIENDKVLLVNHHSLNLEQDFWGPPGGGMEFGTSAEDNLKREFYEETGISIEVEKFLFVHEYLKPPLHAIELIFKVNKVGGELKIGFDPEMKMNEQIIKDVRFIPVDELELMEKETLHQLFNNVPKLDHIQHLGGYYIRKEDRNA
jgi:8-oxo-dGTP diphosphatase